MNKVNHGFLKALPRGFHPTANDAAIRRWRFYSNESGGKFCRDWPIRWRQAKEKQGEEKSQPWKMRFSSFLLFFQGRIGKDFGGKWRPEVKPFGTWIIPWLHKTNVHFRVAFNQTSGLYLIGYPDRQTWLHYAKLVNPKLTLTLVQFFTRPTGLFIIFVFLSSLAKKLFLIFIFCCLNFRSVKNGFSPFPGIPKNWPLKSVH